MSAPALSAAALWMTTDCICTIDGCADTGYACCSGCGGDQCICVCGGHGDCPGCPDCEDADG